MRIVRPVVRTVGTLTEVVRDVGRVREIAMVLARHGLGLLVAGLDIPGLRDLPRRFESTPERVVAAIEELGPTFIKLGQVLSTRPDVIPAPYIAALQALQDRVAPLPFERIRALLDQELSPGWRTGIPEVEREALASASIAQVHRARLADGREVVLKVQRPDVARRVEADLSILHVIVRRLLVEFPEAVYFDPEGILAEFERSIRAEIDFRMEAANARRFRANFADDPAVHIPEVHRAFTTARVLCMEYLDGTPIRRAREAGFDMRRVGERYLHVAYKMLFEHGFFHGDLHPGNVLVLENEVLGLLDFGMVGTLTREMIDRTVVLLFALQRGDYRTIARVFYDLAIKDERVDYAAFERDATELIQRNWAGVTIQEMQIGQFLQDLARGAIRHRVRTPPNYTMYFKALLTTEGLAKSLVPEVDPLHEAAPHVDRLIRERLSAERLREDAFYQAIALATLLDRLPHTLGQLLDDFDNDRLRLRVVREDGEAHATDRARARRAAVTAAVGTALILAGALLATSDTPLPPYAGLAVLGVGLGLGIVAWLGSGSAPARR